MQLTRHVPYEAVVDDVLRTFRLTETDWVADAPEYVGEALAAVGAHASTMGRRTLLPVADYKVALPTDCVSVARVWRGSVPQLPGPPPAPGRAPGEVHADPPSVLHPLAEVYFEELRRAGLTEQQLRVLGPEHSISYHEALHRLQQTQQEAYSDLNVVLASLQPQLQASGTYAIAHGVMQVGWSEGICVLDYRAYLIDERGMPLVPDTHKFRQACLWYVMRSLLLAGVKHPVVSFADAEAMFEKFRRQASNEPFLLTDDELEVLARAPRLNGMHLWGHFE